MKEEKMYDTRWSDETMKLSSCRLKDSDDDNFKVTVKIIGL